MSMPDGLIVVLPEGEGDPQWMRVVDGAIVQSGSGANWLAACGLVELPADTMVMLVPPAALVTLHWSHHPDLPARQGRAVAKLEPLAGGVVPSDQLFVAADANEDPAQPHMTALAARSDMQHWLLWAQHHGLDPDIIVPAPLLLPPPDEGFHRAIVGGASVLRGVDIALAGDLALFELIGNAPIRDVAPEEVNRIAVEALERPPLDMRQGDFAKRVRRPVDKQAFGRIALWSGLILLISLAIALIGIVRQNVAANNLDAQSLALARQVVPNAGTLSEAEAEMDRQLARRGAGGYAFTAPVAVIMSAVQNVSGVSLTALSRDPDGMIRATLAAAKADDINQVLLALQAAGLTITATPSQDPGGRTLADITVRS